MDYSLHDMENICMYVRHFNPFSIKTKLDLVKTFETAILNLKKKKKKKKKI